MISSIIDITSNTSFILGHKVIINHVSSTSRAELATGVQEHGSDVIHAQWTHGVKKRHYYVNTTSRRQIDNTMTLFYCHVSAGCKHVFSGKMAAKLLKYSAHIHDFEYITLNIDAEKVCIWHLTWYDVVSWHGNSCWWVISPHKGPVLRSFDVFFDVDLKKKLLNKQSYCWWDVDGHVASFQWYLLLYFDYAVAQISDFELKGDRLSYSCVLTCDTRVRQPVALQCDELSRRQGKVHGRKDRRTDIRRQRQ